MENCLNYIIKFFFRSNKGLENFIKNIDNLGDIICFDYYDDINKDSGELSIEIITDQENLDKDHLKDYCLNYNIKYVYIICYGGIKKLCNRYDLNIYYKKNKKINKKGIKFIKVADFSIILNMDYKIILKNKNKLYKYEKNKIYNDLEKHYIKILKEIKNYYNFY